MELTGRPDRRAVGEWALDQLHEMIFSGELKAGDVLNEVALTQRLRVSRSPIRDALKELEHAGLIDVDEFNGRRTLRDFGLSDVIESYDLRTELEALSARYAAREASELALRGIDESLQAMRDAQEAPLDVWLPLDFEFHARIARASGARRVPYVLSGVWIQHLALLRGLERLGSYPATTATRDRAILDHGEILAAIRSRDPAKADAAVRLHLLGRRDAVVTQLSSGRPQE